MNTPRLLTACLLIAATWCAVNLTERPKYKSPEVIPALDIPETLPGWRSRDFSAELKQQADDRYNFISDAFARVYADRTGNTLLFMLLDAGNFHHPKICFTSSGFTVEPLENIRLGPLKAKALLARRGEEAFIVLYWMVIDGRQVDWTEQKWKQLWYSLFGRQRAGIMGRIDVPVNPEDTERGIKKAIEFISDISQKIPADSRTIIYGKQEEK